MEVRENKKNYTKKKAKASKDVSLKKIRADSSRESCKRKMPSPTPPILSTTFVKVGGQYTQSSFIFLI